MNNPQMNNQMNNGQNKGGNNPFNRNPIFTFAIFAIIIVLFFRSFSDGGLGLSKCKLLAAKTNDKKQRNHKCSNRPNHHKSH